MRIPYIKIKQKNEVFFITKFKATELQKRVNFHFRDPYSDEEQKKILYKDYISKLEKKGISIIADEEGVQRRLQISRINKIKDYLEKEMDSYFPTSIVLAVDVSVEENFLYNYEDIEDKEFGEIELSDDVTFQIVDGQHRLAGLFISDESIIDDFEISAVLLFNATSHTCAKIFADINGKRYLNTVMSEPIKVFNASSANIAFMIDCSCSEYAVKIGFVKILAFVVKSLYFRSLNLFAISV